MTDSSFNPPVQQPGGSPMQPAGMEPAAFAVQAPQSNPVWSQGVPATALPTSGTRGLYTAAAIINWVVLAIIIAATAGFGIVAAAWFIPMTILIHKGAKGPYKHTALGVCTLLFCNIISGILMLVDDSNRPAKPTS